jgi:hypothetical protein
MKLKELESILQDCDVFGIHLNIYKNVSSYFNPLAFPKMNPRFSLNNTPPQLI